MFSSYRAAGLDIDIRKTIYYIVVHDCCFVHLTLRSDDLALKERVI
jgi:hypothetical protein